MNDPKLQHCKCGYSWRPTSYQKIRMLLQGYYVKTCPRCGCKMKLVLYYFVVCKERRNIDKRELWRNA